MNNKAQSLAPISIAFMIGIALVVLAMALAPSLNELITLSSNSNNMDCGNESISVFNRVTCITTDSSQFLFIGGLIFLAFAIIVGARRLY